jgi:hypothetical protein
MGVFLNNKTLAAVRRWIKPYMWSHVVSTSTNSTAGRVRLSEFEITEPTAIDGILIYNFATVAGNVRVGIYGSIPTEETAVNSSLVVESADTVLSGTTRGQFIDLAQTTLPTGRYYLACQFSDVTHTFAQNTNANPSVISGWSQTYDRVGGYGAFTNPCPAVSALTTLQFMTLRAVV